MDGKAERYMPGADLVRAVACLMVMVHHYLQHLDFGVLPPLAHWLAVYSVSGSFGVSAFFVLSGYLLSLPFWRALYAGQPMPSLKIFALRRFARIAPAYWLALAATLVLTGEAYRMLHDPMTAWRAVAGFLFINGWHWSSMFPTDQNGPLWSIGIEVTSYFFMPFGMILLFRWRPARPAVMLLFWVAVLLVTLGIHWLILKYLPYTHDRVGWQYGVIGGAKDWMPRFSPISFFAIYALGVLAAGVQLRLPKGTRLGYDIILLGGLFIVARALQVNMYNSIMGYGLFGVPYKFPWFPAGVAIILAAIPGSVVFNRIADNGLVAFLARISFGLYLWHYFILWLIGKYWIPSVWTGGMKNIPEWLTVAGADFAISVVIATLSFYLLEQPVIRWARRLEGRLKAAPARSLRQAKAA